MCRLVLAVITSALTALSIILIIFAIFTPAWQIVYLTDLKVTHEHGLLLDCFTNSPTFGDFFLSDHRCTYKFSNENSEILADEIKSNNYEENAHKFHKWHKAIIYFFLSSIILAGAALTFIFCTFCFSLCGVVANVFLLLSFATSFCAMITFHIYTNKTEFRLISVRLNVYEQKNGYSSVIGGVAVFFLFLSFLSSILVTVSTFFSDHNLHQSSTKTNAKFSTLV
uniref:Clc-like protein n=1 Tax=Rhabditophanes sp. KR3021 TaxID=114890 RepID=A0AC35U691_9BILA